VRADKQYQKEALQKQLNAVLHYPDRSGVYIWQFCDIRISEEWFGTTLRTMNNKGIVDEFRRRKLAYDVVKEIFEKE
jgi:beta-glucuronidase